MGISLTEHCSSVLTNGFPVLNLLKQRGKLVYYVYKHELEGKENGHLWMFFSVLFDFDSHELNLPINTQV